MLTPHAISLSSLWPYAGVLIAAVLEGELTYIAAAALVGEGRLNALGVLVCGAVGASIGDQAFFYAFRGRLPRWMARYPVLQRKAEPLIDRVRRHDSVMVLLIRFAPGLRVAIAAACAWADVSPRKFTGLNLLSSFLWATALLVLVAWFGPTLLAQYGLGGWKGSVVLGLVVYACFRLLGKYERRTLGRADSN